MAGSYPVEDAERTGQPSAALALNQPRRSNNVDLRPLNSRTHRLPLEADTRHPGRNPSKTDSTVDRENINIPLMPQRNFPSTRIDTDLTRNASHLTPRLSAIRDRSHARNIPSRIHDVADEKSVTFHETERDSVRLDPAPQQELSNIRRHPNPVDRHHDKYPNDHNQGKERLIKNHTHDNGNSNPHSHKTAGRHQQNNIPHSGKQNQPRDDEIESRNGEDFSNRLNQPNQPKNIARVYFNDQLNNGVDFNNRLIQPNQPRDIAGADFNNHVNQPNQPRDIAGADFNNHVNQPNQPRHDEIKSIAGVGFNKRLNQPNRKQQFDQPSRHAHTKMVQVVERIRKHHRKHNHSCCNHRRKHIQHEDLKHRKETNLNRHPNQDLSQGQRPVDEIPLYKNRSHMSEHTLTPHSSRVQKHLKETRVSGHSVKQESNHHSEEGIGHHISDNIPQKSSHDFNPQSDGKLSHLRTESSAQAGNNRKSFTNRKSSHHHDPDLSHVSNRHVHISLEPSHAKQGELDPHRVTSVSDGNVPKFHELNVGVENSASVLMKEKDDIQRGRRGTHVNKHRKRRIKITDSKRFAKLSKAIKSYLRQKRLSLSEKDQAALRKLKKLYKTPSMKTKKRHKHRHHLLEEENDGKAEYEDETENNGENDVKGAMEEGKEDDDIQPDDDAEDDAINQNDATDSDDDVRPVEDDEVDEDPDVPNEGEGFAEKSVFKTRHFVHSEFPAIKTETHSPNFIVAERKTISFPAFSKQTDSLSQPKISIKIFKEKLKNNADLKKDSKYTLDKGNLATDMENPHSKDNSYFRLKVPNKILIKQLRKQTHFHTGNSEADLDQSRMKSVWNDDKDGGKTDKSGLHSSGDSHKAADFKMKALMALVDDYSTDLHQQQSILNQIIMDTQQADNMLSADAVANLHKAKEKLAPLQGANKTWVKSLTIPALSGFRKVHIKILKSHKPPPGASSPLWKQPMVVEGGVSGGIKLEHPLGILLPDLENDLQELNAWKPSKALKRPTVESAHLVKSGEKESKDKELEEIHTKFATGNINHKLPLSGRPVSKQKANTNMNPEGLNGILGKEAQLSDSATLGHDPTIIGQNGNPWSPASNATNQGNGTIFGTAINKNGIKDKQGISHEKPSKDASEGEHQDSQSKVESIPSASSMEAHGQTGSSNSKQLSRTISQTDSGNTLPSKLKSDELASASLVSWKSSSNSESSKQKMNSDVHKSLSDTVPSIKISENSGKARETGNKAQGGSDQPVIVDPLLPLVSNSSSLTALELIRNLLSHPNLKQVPQSQHNSNANDKSAISQASAPIKSAPANADDNNIGSQNVPNPKEPPWKSDSLYDQREAIQARLSATGKVLLPLGQQQSGAEGVNSTDTDSAQEEENSTDFFYFFRHHIVWTKPVLATVAAVTTAVVFSCFLCVCALCRRRRLRQYKKTFNKMEDNLIRLDSEQPIYLRLAHLHREGNQYVVSIMEDSRLSVTDKDLDSEDELFNVKDIRTADKRGPLSKVHWTSQQAPY